MNSSHRKGIVGFTCASLVTICVTGCSRGVRSASEVTDPPSPPSFTVMDRDLAPSPRFIVYGDMRFTGLGERKASSPGPRRLLVARIGGEKPDAVFLTGDVPWHGGNRVDYEIFAQETATCG